MTAGFAWVDFIPETKQSFDKDGFLLCRDVPVARTGIQLYGPGETPIEPVTGDVVRIERDEEEVFHPETLASLQGASVVNDHPVDGNGQRCDVTPDNWRDLAVGHVENPRRGEGVFSDFVVANLRIKDRNAIDLIRSGKRQVSAGYDADYEELGPNHGRQKNIRCNHLALVDNARCGPICAIGDEDTLGGKEVPMPTPFERVRTLAKKYGFKARDQAELESALADAEEEGEGGEEGEGNGNGNGNEEHHVHVHLPPNGVNGSAETDQGEGENIVTISPEEVEELWSANQAEMDAISRLAEAVGGGDSMPKFHDSYPHRDARRKRMGIDAARPAPRDNTGTADPAGSGGTAILREFEMEAPSGSQVVDVRKTTDSRYLEESWGATVAKGEIIVPGARPTATFDRAAPREQTYDAICGFRRAVLDMAYVKPDGRAIIDGFTRNRFTDTKSLSCGKVRELFDHVAEVKRLSNNNGGSTGAVRMATVGDGRNPPIAGVATLADMQKQLDDFYAKKAN